MYPRPIPENKKLARLGYMAGVLAILILWLLPLFAVIMTSFRSFDDVMSGNYWGWPTKFSLTENYVAVFEQTKMLRYFTNSLIITIPSVIAVLILSTLTGFVLSRYRFRGSMVIFAIFVGGNFLPQQIMMWRSRRALPRSSCATSSPPCRTNCSRRREPKAHRPGRR
jgi:multiple sugar transport system permease protein